MFSKLFSKLFWIVYSYYFSERRSDKLGGLQKPMTGTVMLVGLIKKPFCFPKLNINRKPEKIEDYTIDDFSILDYQHHQTIKMDMRK